MTSKELHPRRHVFHGHASGVAAHIRRPKNAVLDVKGCSTLPVIGGHTEHKVGKTKLGKWVSFQSAHTSAHGDYENAAHGVATTRGKPFDEAATKTSVSARVRGMNILGRVSIADLNLYMESRTGPGMAQPSIRLKGNRIDGVKIDGAKRGVYTPLGEPLRIRLDGGKHRLSIEAPGRKAYVGEIEVPRGQELGVHRARRQRLALEERH